MLKTFKLKQSKDKLCLLSKVYKDIAWLDFVIFQSLSGFSYRFVTLCLYSLTNFVLLKMADDEIHRIETISVDGFRFPALGFFEKTVREVFNYQFLPGDIVLSTFPKCGTTWSQFIIWGIVNNGEAPPDTNIVMLKEFPFLELTGLQALEPLSSPRLIKLHLPYRLTPKQSEAKYICIMRNPFDCCTSYYSHLNGIDAKTMGKRLNFESYFQDFLDGVLPFGDYFEHVESWYEHKDDPNVLFFTYEEMRADPKEGVLKIAKFLGKEHGDKLINNPEILENVLKHSSFKYMKESKPFRCVKDMETAAKIGENLPNEMIDPSKYKDDNIFTSVKFYREATVGGSKNELTPEQWEKIEKAIDEKIKYPELRDLMRKIKI